MNEQTFDEQYEKAQQAAAAADTSGMRARLVHYEPAIGQIVVHLQNGERFVFSPSSLTELAHGTSDELAQVSIAPSGDGLHWAALDVDIGIVALREISLDELLARVETAWLEQRNDQLVDEQAERYPQFKEELYDFFGLLLEGELSEPRAPEAAASSVKRTKQWLYAEGFALAAQAAQKATSTRTVVPHGAGHPPESDSEADEGIGLLGLVLDETGCSFEQILQETDIPDVVMTYVDDYYDVTPFYYVREEVIDRLHRKYQFGKARLHRVALGGARVNFEVAAFRTSSYQPGIPNLIERLKKSALAQTTKDYWIALAEMVPPNEET